ncbi:hypothetical protein ACSRUE_06190 [Sorangium sp. KYC3313]|uniref:hypothetical protein n=1 Tax=unclassified Sorangium TaxID=2621164 RepID=UPI003F644181
MKRLLTTRKPKNAQTKRSPSVHGEPMRTEIFQDAVARFEQLLGKAVPGTTTPLDDRRYDRVLYVHMAALATVEGRPFTAETLTGSTLA